MAVNSTFFFGNDNIGIDGVLSLGKENLFTCIGF